MKGITHKEQLRRAWMAADERFSVECRRQFGSKAGDYRYCNDAHDDATAVARDAFHAAGAAYHEAN